MARPVTLDDVAQKVGVSARTVSRVVNSEPGFSEETRARVQAAIDELGYRPNFMARGLVSGRSQALGFVVPDITNPFFPQITRSMHRAARQHGYSLFLCDSEDDGREQAALLDSMLSQGSDGAIVFPAIGGEQQLMAVAEAGLPLVLMDSHVTHPRIANVNSDIRGGAEMAVDHFVNVGRRTIGMVTSHHSPPQRRWRETGFRAAAKRHNLDMPRGRIIRVEPDTDGGYRAALDLINSFPTIDAIFAYNDTMALGVLAACTEKGRTVPDDIAVIGFDGIELGQFVTPKLSTVVIDRPTVGRVTVETLLAMLDTGEPPAEPVVVPTSLVFMESA